MFDYLIVGAGFAGSVTAERLAVSEGASVLVVDRRNHIAGNAYDFYDDAGIWFTSTARTSFTQTQQRSSNIFHASPRGAHTSIACSRASTGNFCPCPSMRTLSIDFMAKISAAMKYANTLQVPLSQYPKIRTSEDVVVSQIGRDLYEKFFRNYTRKQWDLDPSELDAAVTARVPVRTSRDDRYFTDRFQAMPLHGYTRMFQKILDHPNIKVMLNTDYTEIQEEIQFRELIFTGPVDEYFDFCYGKLPYRSLRFEHQTHNKPLFQSAAVVNFPNEHQYTRATEFKYLTGQEHPKTSVVYEYPQPEGDPYYPVPQSKNTELYAKYKALAETLPNVHFAGRLGTYKYYNMDQVVAQALTLSEKLSARKAETGASLNAGMQVGSLNGKAHLSTELPAE